MTDEERAREIASYLGHSHEVRARFVKMVAGHFAAIRADEREKCAKEVEALMRPDPSPFATSMMAALNSNLRDAAAAIRADVVVPPYVASRIAAAIRAMGDKP